MSKRSPNRLVEASTVILFWIQATRVLFSTLFGVIYDTIFDAKIPLSSAALILGATLLAFLAPAILGRGRVRSGSDRWPAPRLWQTGLFTFALVTAVARVPLTLVDPPLRLASALLVVATASLYLALFLRGHGAKFPTAILLALLVDQVARVRGVTWDITLQPRFLPFQIFLCLGLIGVAWTAYSREQDKLSEDGQLGAAGGLGLGAFLFLQTAVMAQPNVLARWTGVPYEWVAPALLVVTAFPLIFITGGRLSLFGGRPLARLREWGVLARAGLVLGCVPLGLLIGRTIGGIVGLAALLLAQLILVLTLPFLASSQFSTTVRQIGVALARGMFCFFLLHLAFVFAFTYPYTIPAFRNSGPLILAVATGIALLPVAFRAPGAASVGSAPVSNQVLIALATALVAVIVWSRPETPPARQSGLSGHLRVATYNIHYGYDTEWAHSLEEQARAIEESGADIVLMQEVDAGRMTSYGVDNALWLARRLEMKAIFAPGLEGLSGIAMLSRLPVLASDWVLLPSELEQTALVHAVLDAKGGEIDAFGVWLGLAEGERMAQATAALELIGDAPRVIFGGDMNSAPDSLIHALIQDANLVDPFAGGDDPAAFTSPAVLPRERIDYIWVRGMEIVAADVSNSLASDHRLVVVELLPGQ